MRRLQICFALLVLLAVTTVSAGTARADSFTLDGVPIDSFGVILAGNILDVEMATVDAAPYLTDLMLGTQIPLLTLDGTFDMTGGPPVNIEVEFFGNQVDFFEPGSNLLTSDVEFHYTTFTETTTTGTPAPEPSSVALLAFGLFGLVGFARKKLRC